MASACPRTDVYGDSYGTYLAQVFALRHPDRTRALILDGAYDDGFDPFARDAAAAMRRTWRTLCARAGTCEGVLGQLSALSRELERRPLVGRGVDGNGARRTVRLTAPALAQLVYDGTYSFAIERDPPGGARRARGRRPPADPAPGRRGSGEHGQRRRSERVLRRCLHGRLVS